LGNKLDWPQNGFDKINAGLAAFVFILTFVIYRLTVQPTLSYWDCGEFIACSYILGIPHPPGSPLFIVLGRLFAILPIAGDACLRINLISVISSAGAVLFGYLSIVRMIKYWYTGSDFTGWKRAIAYIGGLVGSLCMAFSATYWANAVEAEVYGLSMLFTTFIFWLMLQYYDLRGTAKATRIIIIVCYLAMLGVGIHLATFLIMPVAAVFFVLKKDAPSRAWIAIGSFFILELLAIIVVSNGRGGYPAFIFLSIVFLLATALVVYKHINWPVLIAIGAFSMVMKSFTAFLIGVAAGTVALLFISAVARHWEWKTGLLVLLAAVLGYSFHLFIPIRSMNNPRIDENNPSRSYEAFVNFLDRKQYGSMSMVERMFERRGLWEHQFGRHANMGFWSYFEEQYGFRPVFGLLFLMGLFGTYFAVRRKVEIGLPFLIIILLGTVGLVLYMNFADGIKFDLKTGDAYLEVRNRDYFFTPGFAFFGLALGLGVAALMEVVRRATSVSKWKDYQKPALGVMSLLVFLPVAALTSNYFENDRSNNYFPRIYAENILNTCQKNAVLFTSGDNDTFPLWCVQEVYGYRKDVRVVNLSLFNTDWYVAQMKNQYDVPISLDDSQILWNTYEMQGREIRRPAKPFIDRPRKRRTYLIPLPHEGRIVKLQDMMVDEVVLENKWRYPLYFSSEPYVESPLNLRDYSVATGVLYKLDTADWERSIDAEQGYHLYKDVYQYDGLNDPYIYRDANATGVMLTLGFNAIRIANEFRETGYMERAYEMLSFIIDKYPEFLSSYTTYSEFLEREGKTEEADSILALAEENLNLFCETHPDNLFFKSDLGLLKHYRGETEEGLAILWEAFNGNRSNGYSYRKLFQVLYQTGRTQELLRATKMHAAYKNNLSDGLVQQVLEAERMHMNMPKEQPTLPLQVP